MTPEQTGTAERLRALLDGEPVTRETSMFGTRAFMVSEKLAVCVQKDGGLLVHIESERHDELVEQGAEQAEMGAGRSMGPGWVTVSAESIAGEDRLRFWVAAALEYNRILTGRAA